MWVSPLRKYLYRWLLAVLIFSVEKATISQGRWSDVLEPAYDEEVALETVKLTQIAYCTVELIDWACTGCRNFPGMRNVTLLDGERRNIRGFIGVDLGVKRKVAAAYQYATSTLDFDQKASQDYPVKRAVVADPDTLRGYQRDASRGRDNAPRPRIVIAFAGTDPLSIQNILDDIEVAAIDQEYGGECEKCKVHEGFVASYKLIEEQIRGTVALHLRRNPTADVLITGHSLGAALATLCLLNLRVTLDAKLSFAPLYIYGSPRVGNAAFATYSASVGVPIFRVVHHRDPVPHIPFKTWGYVHPPREVFYDDSMTSYVVCDGSGEDPTCSYRFFFAVDVFAVRDHLTYLEVDYTLSYLQCLLLDAGEGRSNNEEEEVLEAAKAVTMPRLGEGGPRLRVK